MISGIKHFIALLLVTSCTMGVESKSLTNKSIGETLQFATGQSMGLYRVMLPQKDRLPRTVSESGKLASSNDSWWTSGFFPGTLWYLYEFTQTEEMRQAAITMTNRVEKQQFTTDNHDVGFIINCSYGNGLRLTGEKKYEQIIVNAAKSLSTRFHPVTGTIRSWNSNKWQYAVIIDNMMNLELLCLATRLSGDSTYARIAIAHADNTLKYHFRPDGSSYHVVSYDTIRGGYAERVTHQGAHDESAWARGQGWGLYGFTMMYRETGKPEYLNQARKIADFLINHPNLPADGIPYWDFNAPKIPDEPRDASAAAVIASALVELSTMTSKKESKKYLAAAEKMLVSLSSPAYLAKTNENGNFILKNSVGFMAKNSEVNAPLTYADYYFVEALLRYRKLNHSKK
jgi:rhamnogalacturonyl hydrolase YesR